MVTLLIMMSHGCIVTQQTVTSTCYGNNNNYGVTRLYSYAISSNVNTMVTILIMMSHSCIVTQQRVSSELHGYHAYYNVRRLHICV